jgi:hypothetical protein
MTSDRAFELDDLMILLSLRLAEPSDRDDIDTIEAILDRRRTDGWSTPKGDDRPGRALYLVPDASS